MSKPKTVLRWRALRDEHNQSGLTTGAFAQKMGINRHTFAYWRSKLNKIDGKVAPRPGFSELHVVPEPKTVSDQTVVLVLDRLDAHIVVDQDTDMSLLLRLLQAVT